MKPACHRQDVKRLIKKSGNISYGWYNFSIQVVVLEPPKLKKAKSIRKLKIPQNMYTQQLCRAKRSSRIENIKSLIKYSGNLLCYWNSSGLHKHTTVTRVENSCTYWVQWNLNRILVQLESQWNMNKNNSSADIPVELKLKVPNYKDLDWNCIKWIQYKWYQTESRTESINPLLHEHFVKNGCFHWKVSRYKFKLL
jgi:hypothetical protein